MHPGARQLNRLLGLTLLYSHTYKQLDEEVQTTEISIVLKTKSSSPPIQLPTICCIADTIMKHFLTVPRCETGFVDTEFGLELESLTKAYKKSLEVIQGRPSIFEPGNTKLTKKQPVLIKIPK